MRPRAFPERVGRYDLLLPLGSGGMANVYLARVRGTGGFEREVALKLVHPHLANEESDGASQLVEEAKIAARIRHRNVVAVTDVGSDPAGVFLVMEYVDGEPLSALLRLAAPERIPTSIVLRILDDTLAGLEAAHQLRGADGAELGLVHRDVSPQNVLLGVDGTARLADFGIAKVIGSSITTRTSQVKGKPGYMSPEQARGEPIDRRSDVWAAGVMAWELFSGVRMFPPGDDLATLLKIVTTGAPRLRSIRPDASPELDDLLAEALASDRASRLPSAEVFRSRLLASNLARVADPSEVAEYVMRVAGERIDNRRREAENASVTSTATLPDDGEILVAAPATVPPRRRPRWGLGAGIAVLVAAACSFAFVRARASSRVTEEPTTTAPSVVSASLAAPSATVPASAAPSAPAAPAVAGPATVSTAGSRPARRAISRPPAPPSPTPSVRPPRLLKDSLDDK